MASTEQTQPVVAAVAPSPSSGSAGSTVDAAAVREAWSRSQLPLMRKVVIGLTVFFFLASAVQLVYLHAEIVNAPQRDFADVGAMLQKAQDASADAADRGLPAAALAALTTLEISAMERRYHQANVSLLSRTWTRYLGFITGMVLAMVGATFILGRLETPATTAKGETPGWKFEIISASPGLVLAVLGVGLMLATIVTHHEIAIQDRPIYAQGWSLGSVGRQDAAPPRPFESDGDPPQAADGGGDGISDMLRKEQDKLRPAGGAAGAPASESTGSSLTR